MIPIKMTHELNEHNYLNVDASILQNHLFFFFFPLYMYTSDPLWNFTLKKNLLGCVGVPWCHMDPLSCGILA